MSGGHDSTLTLHHAGDSAVHRLPAHTKIVAAFAFVFAVVATPREAVWAFALDGAVILGLLVAMRLPPAVVLRRLRIEIPLLGFALLLPVFGDGWWAAWNIAAKATLGVLAAIVLSASTPPAELVAGLERIHVPHLLVAIAGFMVRYLDVIVADASRTRIARLSRADDPRWIWQARGVAASAGTLFVRSYERGERVHLAMLSRGYDGHMPVLHEHATVPREWMAAAVIPSLAVGAMLVARFAL